MDYFEEQVNNLRGLVEIFLRTTGVSIDDVEKGGVKLLEKTDTDSWSAEEFDAPESLSPLFVVMPWEVIRSICLGSVYLRASLVGYRDGDKLASVCLAYAAQEIGFVTGAAFGVDFGDSLKRADLSKFGAKGALQRHRPVAQLKEWALMEAEKQRGAQRDVARALAGKIPIHLADVSKDPERLIYDTLRTVKKKPSGSAG